MNSLGKIIYYSEYGCVTSRRWQFGDKVHSYVGTGTAGKRQMAQQADWRLVGGLAEVAN